MSVNLPNEGLQSTLERSFIFINDCLGKQMFKDIGEKHLKYVLYKRALEIVKTDRACDSIQRSFDLRSGDE